MRVILLVLLVALSCAKPPSIHSCKDLFSCVTQCRSDDRCAERCARRATDEALARYYRAAECAADHCAGFHDAALQACIMDRCLLEMGNCLGHR
jgi:hypothetical protein